jgi:DNA-binding NarL/FixJ family response regulator
VTSGEEVRRILVVDDHPMFRAGLVALIQDLDGFEVVAEAADGAEAVAAARAHAPDVVLMDLQMPGTNGLEATRAIMSAQSEVAVLVMTMVENDDAVAAALRAGARGYLVKGSSRDHIVRALTAVSAGEVILGAAVGPSVLSRLAGGDDGLAPLPGLSAREREVLELMAAGLDNPTIARRLFLSEKTIRNIVSAVFTKLDVNTRAAAVAKARDAGLGGSPL